MDCIELEDKASQALLMTHQDKLQKLQSIFANNEHKSDLFLPDEDFYGNEVTVDDPERMAGILFKWLGVKHRSVTFHIDPNQDKLIQYKRTNNTSKVSLGLECLEDNFVCGAAVVHAVVHHLLISRAKLSLGDPEEDEVLADLGTIYSGFGVIILNSLRSKKVLGSMGEMNYSAEFLDYCSNHRIVDSIWQGYVLPDISADVLQRPSQFSNLRPYVISRIQRAHSHRFTTVFTGMFLFVLMSVFTVIYLNRPASLSAEMREKQDAVAVLRAEIDRCEDTVKRKQQTWDQTDIFIQRQIDADKTRCASLISRYNYELNQYNSNL
jgi:hypothetical protein